MPYDPGQTVSIQRQTQNISGAITDADSLPTCVLVKNGEDTAEVVVVTDIGTGLYLLEFTIPSSYVYGDQVAIRMTATVNATIGSNTVFSERLAQGFIQGPVGGTTVSEVLGAAPIKLSIFEKAHKQFSLALTDVNGDAIDASSMNFRFRVETRVEPSAELFETTTITISGSENNIINITVSITDSTQTPGVYNWRLWDDATKDVYLHGEFVILSTSE